MQKRLDDMAKIFYSGSTKLIGIAFITAMLFLSLAIPGNSLAHAATQPYSGVIKPASNCRVTSVLLRGTNAPIVKCLQSAIPSGRSVHPFTFSMPCNGYENMALTYGNGTSICFGGSGYTGVYASNLYAWLYTIHNAHWGWMRMYDATGGHWLSMPPDSSLFYQAPFQITQLCLDCGSHS